MRSRIALGFGLLCIHSIAAPGSPPDSHWLRIVSAHFEMYTDVSESAARDTVRYFELVRSFVRQVIPGVPATPARIRIVAFDSFKGYQPYRPNEFTVAHLVLSPDGDSLVLGQIGADALPSAIHEYAHLLITEANPNLPLWLSEGIAELYSNLKPAGENMLVGAMIETRRVRLLEDRPIPFPFLLAAGKNSSYYNPTDQSGIFFNQSWALAHMLVLSPEYGPKFTQLLLSLSRGTPSLAALEQTYGKPVSKIELEWRAYVHSDIFKGLLIPAKHDDASDRINVESADDFDVSMTLARIGDRAGNEAATRAALSNLIRQNPNRFEPYGDLAYLELRQGNAEQARGFFAKAYDLGGRDPRMLWSYGRLMEPQDPPKSIELFHELVALAPQRLDARLELASLQDQSHHVQEALEILEPVTNVSREDAPKLLTLLARLNLEAGNRERARNAADQLKKISIFAADRERADELLQVIESQPSRPADVLAIGKDSDAPVLKHREAVEEENAGPATPGVADPKRPSVAGAFVELQCGEQVKIVLDTADGKRVLLIDDPRKLSINSEQGAVLDLSCGPQNRTRLTIEFDAPADKTLGVDGVARVVHIDP